MILILLLLFFIFYKKREYFNVSFVDTCIEDAYKCCFTPNINSEKCMNNRTNRIQRNWIEKTNGFCVDDMNGTCKTPNRSSLECFDKMYNKCMKNTNIIGLK